MALKVKFIIVFLFLYWNIFAQNSLKSELNFGENPGNLRMYTYTPSKLDATKKYPLVIVIHGCTQSAQKISDGTGWNKLADSLNFMVLYPEQKIINNIGNCFNFFIGFESKKDKGELASIKQMIDHTLKNKNIDSSKIFITGMSAGGGMSNALLNAYPYIFNSGALIAAPSILMAEINDSANHIPKIAILHGDSDPIVPKKNAKKILNQWIKKNKLKPKSFEFKENYLNNPLLSAKYYYNSNKQLKIITLNVKTIKHKLLIDPGEDIKHGGTMISRTEDIDFHSTYWIADFFGLTKSKSSIFR